MLGIVLLAHGSRDPLWRAPVESVAARVRALDPRATVRCAYLELAAPDLDQAVAELAADGVLTVRIVPLFFGVGRHLRHDLPELVRGLQRRHPGLAIEVRPALGEDERLLDLIARNALATDGRP